ncbi:MAG: gluconokinase, partial [Planctomycetota bacterium]
MAGSSDKTNAPVRWVVMGVSGCGKSTVGRALAEALRTDFYDADDFHPEANVAKMASGQPLNDDDRGPWLDRLSELLRDRPGAVLACSALKKAYRDRLSRGGDAVRFAHLHADFSTLQDRMLGRDDHFMPAALLKSQLDTLEPPTPDEALILDATLGVDQLVAAVVDAGGSGGSGDCGG